MAALSTAAGRGASHRSGFHSSASAPQSALLRLHARMLTKMFVPRGTAISWSSVPSVARMGLESGRMVS